MDDRSYVLLFDRDCGICSASARWIHVLDLRFRIRVRAIQGSRDLLMKIPEDRLLDAVHVVGPDGRVSSGGEALPTLIEALPMGLGFGRLLRGSAPLMTVVHRSYGFISRFRDRLVCRLGPAATSAGSVP